MIKEVTRIIIFSPYMTGLLSLHGKAQFLYKELAVVTIIFKNYSMSVCWILDGNYSSHWGAYCQVGQNHSDQTIESELDIEAILAVMNTTELVIEIRPKKIQAHTGFEPMTSVIPVQHSTNRANKPTGNWSLFWIQINLPSGE